MTTATHALARDRAAGAARGRWLMLIVLLAGQFMALLDVTIVNVAMPTIGRTLHATGAELQLVVAGYTVSYAMMLITGARMGDLFGRRRMFLSGVLVFTVASLACGIAPGIEILIAARFVQGAGAAAMIPQIMSVIQVRFSGAARARALSAYTAVLSSGFVAGQVVGGVLVTANLFGQSWRPVFLVNVPIGLAVLALVPLVMPADEPGQHRRRLDLTGLAIAVPAVFLIVLPLMLGHQEDWPGWIFACMAGGVVLAVVFAGVERRIADRGGDPLLNLAVLRAPGLVPGLAAVAVLMITYGGFLFSFALHLQAGLGDSALRAGLTFAPCAVVFGLCGYFWRRIPSGLHHLIAPLGCLVVVGGYAWVAIATLGLIISNVSVGRALTFCDIYPNRCQYTPSGKGYYYPLGYRLPSETPEGSRSRTPRPPALLVALSLISSTPARSSASTTLVRLSMIPGTVLLPAASMR